MKKDDLVSVIVIAYNIEKCIESIEKQYYKNIEIIIVDDGSTDNTSKIVKKIALKNKKITYIRKKNGGPSSARNNGINVAKGSYITFVDGDDFVARDYVGYLYSLIKKSKSDFAFSRNLFISKKQSQVTKDKIKLLTSEEATSLLMATEVVVGSYNKIYRRSFLNENKIRFNENLFYGEGLFFITTVSQLANRVCVGERRVYYYRKNNFESATTLFDIDKIKNGEQSIFLIKNNLKIKSENINNMILLHLSVYYLGAAINLINYKQKNRYKIQYKEWMSFVRKNLIKLLINPNVSSYRKLMLLTGSLFPYLLAKLDIIRRKRIIINSFN